MEASFDDLPGFLWISAAFCTDWSWSSQVISNDMPWYYRENWLLQFQGFGNICFCPFDSNSFMIWVLVVPSPWTLSFLQSTNLCCSNLLYSTLVTGTKNFRCCCAEVASLWLQNTRDQAELEDNQETITHTKVGHFSHSKLGVCVDPCWYHLGTLGSLHQTFPDCGNHMESLQESLARILEEKSRLEKEKEALEAAEDAAFRFPKWTTAVVEETHHNTPLILLVLSRGWEMDGNGMIVHRC